MKKAIIKSVSGGIFLGLCDEGFEVSLHSPGKIKQVQKLVVGDIVYYDEENYNTILKIEPRKNEFIRPKSANIDIFLIVQSTEEPKFDSYLVDKLIVTAVRNLATPVLYISKADMNENLAQENCEKYTKVGIETYLGRLHGNNYQNIIKVLKGKIVLLVGNSGVGKSTFLNNMHGEELQRTNMISKKLGRGKHTTRQAEIFSANGFYLIDTPGFSSFDLIEMGEHERLSDYFPEMKRLQDKCKFNTCTHIHEPNCAIKEAVEKGIIAKSRYRNYLILYDELERGKTW